MPPNKYRLLAYAVTATLDLAILNAVLEDHADDMFPPELSCGLTKTVFVAVAESSKPPTIYNLLFHTAEPCFVLSAGRPLLAVFQAETLPAEGVP